MRTPVAQLRWLSDKYPWEMYEPPYPPNYEINSTTIVLLEEWLWHWITNKGWYAIKQRNQTKPNQKENILGLPIKWMTFALQLNWERPKKNFHHFWSLFIWFVGYHPPFSTQWTSPSTIYSSSYKYQGRLKGEEQLLIRIVLERWRLEIALDHITCYRNNGSQYYRWTIALFCIH